MIDGFVMRLSPDFLLCSRNELQFYTGKSKIFCTELAFAMYSQIPESCAEYIDAHKYQAYRTDTRMAFKRFLEENVDLPEFTTFTDLVEYLGTSKQALAKAMCLQRSLMDRYDQTKQAHLEVVAAVAHAMGPDFIPFLGAATPRDQAKRQPARLRNAV